MSTSFILSFRSKLKWTKPPVEKKLFFILISFSMRFAAHVSTQDGVEHWQEWKPEGIETVYFFVSADL